MEAERLVHNANQIALFYAPYPRQEAIAGIAGHMKSFWPVRMRRQFKDYVAGGGSGLHELAVAAAEQV